MKLNFRRMLKKILSSVRASPAKLILGPLLKKVGAESKKNTLQQSPYLGLYSRKVSTFSSSAPSPMGGVGRPLLDSRCLALSLLSRRDSSRQRSPPLLEAPRRHLDLPPPRAMATTRSFLAAGGGHRLDLSAAAARSFLAMHLPSRALLPPWPRTRAPLPAAPTSSCHGHRI